MTKSEKKKSKIYECNGCGGKCLQSNIEKPTDCLVFNRTVEWRDINKKKKKKIIYEVYRYKFKLNPKKQSSGIIEIRTIKKFSWWRRKLSKWLLNWELILQ